MRRSPAPRWRCFQHGGARGIGARKVSRNAWKHRLYGAAAITERREISPFIRQCQQTLRDMEDAWKAGRWVGIRPVLCRAGCLR